MKNIVTRTIWCHVCHGGSPQKHTINYKGTAIENKMTMAKFESECTRCKQRAELGLQDPEPIKKHVISIVSYNALIQKEIYETSFAV